MTAVKYEILPGFFSQGIVIPAPEHKGIAQKEIHTQPIPLAHCTATSPVEQVTARFGLVDESSDRWARLRDKIAEIDSCKLLLLVRHGEGYHNVAQAKYGIEACRDYWFKLEGDGELVWGPDPMLTAEGISQAQRTREVWDHELKFGLEPPGKIFCSPHSRALKTCEIVFNGYFDKKRVTVVENCRERNGVNSCDRRSTRSFIAKTFPQFNIEDSLTEEDDLWSPDIREPWAEVAARAKGIIAKIWDERPDDWFVGVTAHSGFINGMLLALGSEPYPLPTAGVLPLVIRRV